MKKLENFILYYYTSFFIIKNETLGPAATVTALGLVNDILKEFEVIKVTPYTRNELCALIKTISPALQYVLFTVNP